MFKSKLRVERDCADRISYHFLGKARVNLEFKLYMFSLKIDLKNILILLFNMNSYENNKKLL